MAKPRESYRSPAAVDEPVQRKASFQRDGLDDAAFAEREQRRQTAIEKAAQEKGPAAQFARWVPWMFLLPGLFAHTYGMLAGAVCTGVFVLLAVGVGYTEGVRHPRSLTREQWTWVLVASPLVLLLGAALVALVPPR